MPQFEFARTAEDSKCFKIVKIEYETSGGDSFIREYTVEDYLTEEEAVRKVEELIKELDQEQS
jgi:hypothetical protein